MLWEPINCLHDSNFRVLVDNRFSSQQHVRSLTQVPDAAHCHFLRPMLCISFRRSGAINFSTSRYLAPLSHLSPRHWRLAVE